MRQRAPALLATSLSLLAAACVSDIPVNRDAGAGQDAGAPDTGAPDTGTPDTGTPDTGTPDTGTPDSGSFSVKNVPGLVLWLDGSKGVTADGNAKVSKWADQSGNTNDAVQASAGIQPALVPQSINGKPALRFTTSTSGPFPRLTIPDATTLRLGTGDFYLTCVVKWSNASNGTLGAIVSKQATPSPFAGYALYMNLPAGQAGGQLDGNTTVSTSAGALNDGTARQYGFARASNTASIRLNGTPSGALPNTNVTSDATGVPLSIGAVAPNGLHPLIGDIAELVIVKGSISGTDVTAIEAYLKAKYAL